MKRSLTFLLSATIILSGCSLFSTSTPPSKKPAKEVVDPVHGKETSMFYGALSGANDVNANGVAFLSSFADGSSRIRVNLNIALAEKGEKYDVSLRNKTTGKSIDVGTLSSILGDVRHAVTLEIKTSTDGYTDVLIHRTGKTSPKIVAEGTLKSAK
jgi:hypothetical protein